MSDRELRSHLEGDPKLSREGQVRTAKTEGDRVLFRYGEDGRIQIRIVDKKGNQTAKFDCSPANGPRILGLSQQEIDKRLNEISGSPESQSLTCVSPEIKRFLDLVTPVLGPESAALLTTLVQPGTKREEVLKIVDSLNLKHGTKGERHGQYRSFPINLPPPNGRLTIKHWQDMGENVISFTWSAT